MMTKIFARLYYRMKHRAVKQRKVLIFILAIIAGICCSLFMKLEYYEKFLTFLGIITVGFFGGNGIEHVAELGFVFRLGDHEVRHRPEHGNVEYAVMRRAVITHYSSPVQAYDNRQILKTHIVNNAINRPLGKC